MSCSLRLVCVTLCAATAGLVFPGRPAWAQRLPGWARPPRARQTADGPEAREHPPVARPKVPPRRPEGPIHRALRRPVSVDFHQTPLDDVAASLQEMCGIPVLLDLAALGDVGLKPDIPVSLRVSDITLRSALQLMLRPVDLTCEVRNDVLMITTPEEAEESVQTRVYPVGDLIGIRLDDGYIDYDFDSLIELITCCVRPESWGDGGPAPIYEVHLGGTAAIVLPQTEEIHEQIASLLEALRSVARQTAEGKSPEPVLFDYHWPEPPAYRLVRDALSKKVSLDFRETPLGDVIDHLRKGTGVNVILDRGALDDVDIPENAAVSFQVADAPLGTALRRMLRDLDLTFQVWDEVLVVTTPEEAELRLTIGIYPVADLIAPVDRLPWVGLGDDILLELISGDVEPATWDCVGGPGSISRVDLEDLDVLVITQRQDVHEQVAAYLARLRDIVQQARSDPAADPVERLRQLFDEVPLHEPPPGALDKKVSFDFDGTPLVDVAKFIAETCEIPCRLDESALRDNGLSPDTEVTLRVSGITLRSGLKLVLDQLELTWVVRGGTLLITTPEEAEQQLTFDIYRVGDLVTFRDEDGDLWEEYSLLVQTVRGNVMPYTWDTNDARIAAGKFAGEQILMVWQTDRGHEEIAALLDELRELAQQASHDGQPPRRARYYGRYYGGMGGGFF